MNEYINKNKLIKYINKNNYLINNETLEYIINKLKNKNSKLFKNLKLLKVGGSISLPSSFIGNTSNSYSNLLTESPTSISNTSTISKYTRPPISSNVFELSGGCGGMCGGGNMNGGCGGMCGGGNMNGGCGGMCGGGNMNGGCVMCSNLFRHNDIKNISKLLNINISKKNYNNVSNYLTNELKNIMQDIFNNVRNNKKQIGKVHFNKSIKNNM
jgi:hypothetical protein